MFSKVFHLFLGFSGKCFEIAEVFIASTTDVPSSQNMEATINVCVVLTDLCALTV